MGGVAGWGGGGVGLGREGGRKGSSVGLVQDRHPSQEAGRVETGRV